MTAPVPVNVMLMEDCTKLDCNILPTPGFKDSHFIKLMHTSLTKIIDDIGEKSATAQGLKRVITSTERLRNSPNHLLYLLKDPNGLDGRGEVIGLLKVGRKHLYIYDSQDQPHEVEPVCVLDFFVIPERQRAGAGKKLFQYMLEDLNLDVNELAIDGPSGKMERFLQKHFSIKCLLRQSNNFAVTPQFFTKYAKGVGQLIETFEQPRQVFGRHAARKPSSDVGDVIHGSGHCEMSQGASQYADVEDVDSPEPWWQFGQVAGRLMLRRDVSERELLSDADTSASESEKRAPDAPNFSTPYHDGQPVVGAEDMVYSEHFPYAQERPNSLQVTPPEVLAAGLPSGSGSSTDHDSFKNLDLKYYHNRLW